jgi:predicted RNA-binding Zn-ribbon protein involved in translation (DUF1610 family)
MERQRTANPGEPRQEVQQVAPGDFAQPSAERRAARRSEDLHVCPSCGSELVHPTEWAPTSDRRWTVDLRCPDCEWTGRGTYAQEVLDRFDEALDDGTESVLNDLSRLARSNMEDDVESFIAALQADQILPEDF